MKIVWQTTLVNEFTIIWGFEEWIPRSCGMDGWDDQEMSPFPIMPQEFFFPPLHVGPFRQEMNLAWLP